MATATTYTNDIDTIAVADAIADCGCWVCCKPMAKGDEVGRDRRALCHPERQQGAGDFGHAACIDDAITSGQGSDYQVIQPPADQVTSLDENLDAEGIEHADIEADQPLTDDEIEDILREVYIRAPDRVASSLHEAVDSVDTAIEPNSTPHERSTARRWVNCTKTLAEKVVLAKDTVDKITQVTDALGQRLDERLGRPTPSKPQTPSKPATDGNGQAGGSAASQDGEGQDGAGQDDQDGTDGDSQDGSTDGGGATEGEGTESEEGEGDGEEADTATDYVTHPEMADAIDEAKQDMDTRLMGVGVNLAEKFAAVSEDVKEVTKALDKFGRVEDSVDAFNTEVDRLNGSLKELAKRAAEQVKVIEIKQADKVTRLDDEHYHPAFAEAMKYIGRGRDIFFTGPTGCGKTHLAAQIARALEVEFSSCSLSEGVDESNFWGRAELNEHGGMEFFDGEFTIRFETGGVYLGDEADGADPNVLLTFNSAISNGFCNVPNRHRKPRADRHERFVFILGANTIGRGADRRYVGRNQLDFSSLKRFEIVTMDYDRGLESKLVAEILEGSEAAVFCGWAHGIRDAIDNNRLEQVFGTRELLWRAEDRQLGDTYEELEAQTFKGWRDDEIAKIKATQPDKKTSGLDKRGQKTITIGPAPRTPLYS